MSRKQKTETQMENRVEPQFLQAQIGDLKEIINIALQYPDDFSTYQDKFPLMIKAGRVFVAKQGDTISAFATFGVSRNDPKECFTSSARSLAVSREELSGDWIRSQLEKALIQKGFRKFTAHVRAGNQNAIKMLFRNGYEQVENTSLLNKNEWLQFYKIADN